MPLRIRAARLEDAAGLVAVLNPIIEDGRYTVLDRPFSAQQERDYLAAFPARGLFLVAERGDGSLAGFQSMEPFASYTGAFDHVGIMGTFVDLEQRREGVGRLLFDELRPRALRLGYQKIFTTIRSDNEASLGFHRALGFEVVGTARRQARIRGRYVDEVIVECFL